MTAKIATKNSTVKKSVQVSLTLGEKFRRVRQKKHVSMLDAESKTLIRAKYLEALEESKFYLLPLPVYTYGFVQTYASFLGLNPKKALQQFQDEYGVATRVVSNPLQFESKTEAHKFVVTPKLFWGGLATFGIASIITYLVWVMVGFAGAPQLVIDSPAQQAEVSDSSVVIAGKTEPGSAVKIGSQPVVVDEFGQFKEMVTVNTSDSVMAFEITSVSRNGKSTKTTRTIKVVPQQAALGELQERTP